MVVFSKQKINTHHQSGFCNGLNNEPKYLGYHAYTIFFRNHFPKVKFQLPENPVMLYVFKNQVLFLQIKSLRTQERVRLFNDFFKSFS